MIRPLGVPVVYVTCPYCGGDSSRPVKVGVWSPPETVECPECEGHNEVTQDQADDIRARRLFDWHGNLISRED